jgi:hypothetical protein
VKIDDDGDLTVKFNERSYAYSPACCVPAPAATVDTVGGTSLGLDNNLLQSLHLGGGRTGGCEYLLFVGVCGVGV